MLYRKLFSYASFFISIIYVECERTENCSMNLGSTIDSRCYWPIFVNTNFMESHKQCQKQEGILADIPDKITLDIVRKNFIKLLPFWIGIHDIYSEGHFQNMLNETSRINEWGLYRSVIPNADCVLLTSLGLEKTQCSSQFLPLCSRKISSYLITTTAAKYDTTQAKEILTTSQAETNISNQTTVLGARCICPCNVMKNRLLMANDDQLKMKIQAIKKELVVNKTSLSTSIRRRTSAQDLRSSSVVIGSVLGIIIIVLSIALIVANDVYQLYRGVRYGLCRGKSEKMRKRMKSRITTKTM